MRERPPTEPGSTQSLVLSSRAATALSVLFLVIVLGAATYVFHTLNVANRAIKQVNFSTASSEFVLLQAVDSLNESLNAYLNRPSPNNLATLRYALDIASYEIARFKGPTKPTAGSSALVPVSNIQNLTNRLNRLIASSADPSKALDLLGPQMDDIVGNLQNSFADLTYTAVVREEAAAKQFGNLRVVTRSVVILIVASLIFVIGVLWWQRSYMLILNRTRSEMESAKSLAEEASRAKSDFLAKISHEIRTPLNAITGLAYLAQNYERDPRLKDYLQKIDGSASVLIRIVNEVLDFSKIESRKLELDRVPFTLNEVFEGFFAIIGVKAQEKNLEILFDLDNRVPNNLVGDPVRLSEVLINIATNAVKFSDSGDILVAVNLVEESSDRVVLRFSIRDQGIGIAPAEQEQIFEMFTQVGSIADRRSEGTGLGLAISQELVGMMGGTIAVESAPNEGSTFTFTAQFELPGGAGSATDRDAADYGGVRVLVVDDNENARRTILSMLDTMRVTATGVSSGPEAVSLFNSSGPESFQVILVDYLMPEMSGITTVSELRRTGHGLGSAKVVLITSDARAAQAPEADAVGLDAVLIKPLTPSSLRRAFGRLLRGEGASAEPDRVAADTWAGHGNGARVLLVEDNELNQQIAREILENSDFRVTLASTGREGLRCLETQAFDAILMDLHMPDLDGYETTKVIRERYAHRNLPILAMTANATSEERERCLTLGMDDFVPKPILPHDLIAKLTKWTAEAAGSTESGAALLSPGSGRSTAKPARLNWEEALARVGGNEELLVRLLREFLFSHRTAAEEFRELLRRDDRPVVQSRAHAIKGAAGNLGATPLSHAAGELESALSGEEADHVAAARLAEFEEELKALLSELNARLGASP